MKSTYQRYLHDLFYGRRAKAITFQGWIIGFDLFIIAFFMIAPFMERSTNFYIIDYIIAFILAIDLGVRSYAYGDFKSWFKKPIVWADIAVLLSFIIPVYAANLGFLRILRLYSLVNSEAFWRVINKGRWNNTNIEEAVRASSNLIIFVFMMSSVVHTLFASSVPHINSFMDSLYFTVTTLSTTGYGDIVLPGTFGKLISIFIMIGGVSLFVRLLQVIMRTSKVRFQCPTCGLMRHDADAVHCKACGTLLNIPNDEG
jgi:voltage-gated potassium channel